jgi:hypothetical protein
MAFTVESTAFAENKEIPEVYVQAGKNISPPLSWRGLPEGTKSLVLILEDPDAPVGTVTHWAAFDLDPKRDGLAGGAGGIAQGVNDMGHARYDGPKPPKGGGPHRYHFRLSALDVETLSLPAGTSHHDIKAKARLHVLGETLLIGKFETR